MSPNSPPRIPLRRFFASPWLLVSALGLLLLGSACKRKTKSPPVRALAWQSIRLGLSQQQVGERVKSKGWLWRCAGAQNLMYADGDGLYSRWIKQAARKRAERCRAERKKGAKLGPERIVHMKMFFVDDKLVRMNVLLAQKDRELMKLLKARIGTPKARMLTRHTYTSKRVAKFRVWALERQTTLLLWLRMANKQELVFLTTDPGQLAVMRSISTSRKGE